MHGTRRSKSEARVAGKSGVVESQRFTERGGAECLNTMTSISR